MTTELTRELEDAMTVAQLIEELQNCDPKAKVCFHYNYGDYWRTEVANTVQNVDEGDVVWSAYHRMPKVVDPDAEDMSKVKGDDQITVVLIGG